MKRKSIVIILAFAFVMTLIAGCNQLVENDNQAQVSESEEIQSQEVQSEEMQSSFETVSEELATEQEEIEEHIGERLESSEINTYGVFDEKIKNSIQENVALKEGTKIENICWGQSWKHFLKY